MNIDSLDIKHWWKAIAAIGLALCIAAVTAKHHQLLLLGLGAIFFGIGEWINRPPQQYFIKQGAGGINGIMTGHPWQPKPLGLILDIIGILLIAFGTFRIIMLA